ncbi:hypothetical protein PAP_08360 [Palaeococcus pacificus DY20341]|uniref:D-glutamate cyclase-like C-terminal domain-containing protein n=1 Tax=Palaeococcus pacificus DY20341 TaxID=1343739 RepID=A0A075LTI2_9EURY|nr:glutamate cyclase domain-containing protein [Palaeococcus pacificus]AIF70060.1 hypothetical protein PAP_08360 [Palaeococcus pacificus DY20341]
MIAHLINTDIGNRGILNVYLDYRKSNPRFLNRASSLLLEHNDRVLIVTGFPIPPLDICETDGPLGALALYNAIEELGGKADILTYNEVKEALKPFGVRFTDAPLLKNYSLLISVELPGRAKDWGYYSMSGHRVKAKPFDGLFLDARELRIPTIGIGDGGNEVGMGIVRRLIKKHVPLGEKIASIVETDELVLSAVSNWGAYGLVAQASLDFGKNLFKGWDERENLETIVKAGLIDGVLKKETLSVDGLSVDLHERFVELLKEIIVDRISP